MLRERLILMLFLVPVGVASTILGCIPKTSGTGGSGGSTTSATSTSTVLEGCNAQPDCQSCNNCATQGVCATQVTACGQDAACSGLDQCLGICGTDADCKSECVSQNPNGIDLYTVAYNCVYCTECPNACKGFAVCNN